MARRALTVVIATIIGGSVAVATQATASATTVPGETVFAYTGAQQTYTVPSNVLLVGIDVAGASGGGGNVGASLGGYLGVNGGETLYPEVGQQGTFGGGATFGGGGAAGQFPGCSGCSVPTAAGSGGGASDVRTCSETATSCQGGGTSDESRLIVASGGSGAGGQGASPGFYCTQLTQAGQGFNQQNPLPTGEPLQGPLPIVTSAGIVIPGEPSNHSYGASNGDETAATGGGATPGSGGSLSTCTTYETNNGNVVSAIFSPTVAGTSGSGSDGAPGASTSGTSYATPEGPNGYLPGAGGGGGGGYTGGGSGAAGYVCTYAVGGGSCYNPSGGTSGGGGSSFESNQMHAPSIDDGIPGPAGHITIAPLVEVSSPTNGAVYTPGQVVDANWSCASAGTPFQGTSCTGAVASGSAISTTPGKHTFTLTVSAVPYGVKVPVSVTYTVGTSSSGSGKGTSGSGAGSGSTKTIHKSLAGFKLGLTGPSSTLAKGKPLTVTITKTGASRTYKVANYTYIIDRGVKHREQARVHGKLKTSTVYKPNLVTSSAGQHSLSLTGFSAGTHTLKVMILLRAIGHEHKPTTKATTLTLHFRIA